MISHSKLTRSHFITLILSLAASALVLFSWTQPNLANLEIDRDLARDLKEISNIHRGDLVWLGPWLDPGLHASSSIYYFFYPALALGQGHPLALVYFTMALALTGILLLAWHLENQLKTLSPLVILIVGLNPLISFTAIHPGNGYTYALLSLIALPFLLKQKLPLLTSALLGLASSMHPGALVLLPIWIYSALIPTKSWRHRLLYLATYLLPFFPLIAYELITKGFITRQFLDNPSSGLLKLQANNNFTTTVSQLISLPRDLFLAGWASLALILRKSRPRHFTWLFLLTLVWFGSLLVSGLIDRYLYAVALTFQILLLFTLARFPRFHWLLFVYVFTVYSSITSQVPPPPASHTISRMVTNSNAFINSHPELKLTPITTMAVLDTYTYVPQADDYRSYLRFNGYNVVDITNSDQAQYLVVFAEELSFDLDSWVNWELNLFGPKTLETTFTIPTGKISIFKSTNHFF